MKNNNKTGFTLIEMMIVVTIIAVLAMMVFKIANPDANNEAVTKQRLELMSGAIESFRAAFGTYPPVPLYQGSQPFHYEYYHLTEDERFMKGSTALAILNDDSLGNGTRSTEGRVFTFGLMSFLAPRVGTAGFTAGPGDPDDMLLETEQWTTFNKHTQVADTPSALRAIETWWPDISGIVYGGARKGREYRDIAYTNKGLTVLDGWRRELVYESAPPYLSYRLWSRGPDGQRGTEDDIRHGDF